MLEQGQDVPEEFLDRPSIGYRFRWLYTAFQDLRLGTSDVAGMGAAISAIKPSEVESWCNLNGIESPGNRRLLWSVVSNLDRVWLSEKAGKRSEEEEGDDGS